MFNNTWMTVCVYLYVCMTQTISLNIYIYIHIHARTRKNIKQLFQWNHNNTCALFLISKFGVLGALETTNVIWTSGWSTLCGLFVTILRLEFTGPMTYVFVRSKSSNALCETSAIYVQRPWKCYWSKVAADCQATGSTDLTFTTSLVDWLVD